MSGTEALARALFQWNTPDDPYFVIKGRSGEVDERDPYIPIVEAILADPGPLLAALAEAGVLTDESRKRIAWLYDDHGPIDNALITERRCVTEWRPTDD